MEISGITYFTEENARFYDKEKYSGRKIKIRYALRLAKSLIDEASLCMKEAKAKHDELERFYIKAMDFSKVNEKLEKILKEI